MTASRSTWLTRAGERVLDLLFPPSCVACRSELAELPDKVGMCYSCREQLELVAWPVCHRCAARVPEIPGQVSQCGHCRDMKLWFDRAITMGNYDGLLRDLLIRMKTDRSELLARALAHLAAEQLGAQLADSRFDVVTSVPMHAWRRLSRGTNPPAAVASHLGGLLGIPAWLGLLQRRRNTQPQRGLSRPGRFRNIRGELQLRKSYILEAAHVLLVDDILTTGATCSESAKVLKRAGADQVTVLVMARTPIG